MIRHEMNHSFWIHLLGEALRNADQENPEAVWNLFWMCEAVACWTGNDDFLVSRQACQGLAEMGTVSLADFHFQFRMELYNGDDGEFDPNKVKRLYGLWTSFLVWLTNGDPVPARSMLFEWAADATLENFERVFERMFGGSLEAKVTEFLTPDWK